ncbi:MAG: flavodoxin family protein [Lachnospiraceae bacterium]|nr:flavodoxin family protein [Lachnospiraceae bacterium]
MKITVVNGTEKHGVTYRMKEIFLEQFRDEAEITEYYLPKDCPAFCAGCMVCFSKGQHLCKDAEFVQKIEKSLLEADLLVFTSPAYVFHATGAMKAMLDHFGYRWMPHRPAGEMFGKRAVIITQCLGAGGKSTAKDIKDSLSWWGVSSIRVVSFRLLSDVDWNKIDEKRKASFQKKLSSVAKKMRAIDYSRPAHTGLVVKAKFYAARMLQTSLGKQNPEYTDYIYWKEKGWIDRARPWSRNIFTGRWKN